MDSFFYLYLFKCIVFIDNIVAIYGKSYCNAAKDTWKLIKDRGVEAIINDNLIGNVITMGAIFIGILCALFGFGYIHLFMRYLEYDGILIIIIILVYCVIFINNAR